MTYVLITVDTELSMTAHRSGVSLSENFRTSINGRCEDGAAGVGWQMDRLDHFGLKGVFLVDPMPAVVYGEAFVADIVGPIVARGHEVQLHIHTEWLNWAKNSPVDDRQGRNIADFSAEDQVVLIRFAEAILRRAGAPAPCAFRAGNYGANDSTLEALARCGIKWDTSFNPTYADSDSRIGLSKWQIAPVEKSGVIEVPVSGLLDRPGRIRPAQVCAISEWEMSDALGHAAANDFPYFVVVTHSFEMLARHRRGLNRQTMDRFSALCDTVAANPALTGSGFSGLPILLKPEHVYMHAGPNLVRTGARMLEQGLAALRYERMPRTASS